MSNLPSPQSPLPAPGWYHDGAGQRWWDGTQWGPYATVAQGSPSPVVVPNRMWATLAHVPVASILLPIIALATDGQRDPFVKIHATEALNFHITTLIVWAVGMAASFLTLGLGALIAVPLLMVVFVLSIVWGIQGAMAANSGAYYQYPVNIRMIKA